MGTPLTDQDIRILREVYRLATTVEAGYPRQEHCAREALESIPRLLAEIERLRALAWRPEKGHTDGRE